MNRSHSGKRASSRWSFGIAQPGNTIPMPSPACARARYVCGRLAYSTVARFKHLRAAPGALTESVAAVVVCHVAIVSCVPLAALGRHPAAAAGSFFAAPGDYFCQRHCRRLCRLRPGRCDRIGDVPTQRRPWPGQPPTACRSPFATVSGAGVLGSDTGRGRASDRRRRSGCPAQVCDIRHRLSSAMRPKSSERS